MIPRHMQRFVFVLAACALLGVLGVVAGAAAGETDRIDHGRFTVSADSLAGSGYVLIGELRIEEDRSLTPRASANEPEMQRCVNEGSEWLRWSEERKSIEMLWGSSDDDTVLAVFCDGDVMLIGGYRQGGDKHDPSRRQAWLFEMLRGAQDNPTKLVFVKEYVVGHWPHETRYRLRELQAIDPDAKRLVFSAVSENGESALLSAPIAIAGRDFPLR